MIFCKKENRVNVVVNDGGLVAVFDKAVPPMVWRFDLQRNHSFALRVKAEADGWDIGVSSPDADFLPVAHFAQEVDARQAFDAVQKVLTYKKSSKFWLALKLLVAAIALLLILSAASSAVNALYRHWTSSSLIGVPMSADVALQQIQQQPVKITPKIGVPQSADDVLRAPQ